MQWSPLKGRIEKVAICGKEGHEWDKTISFVTILKKGAQESWHK